MSQILLAGAVLLWGAAHSALAAQPTKDAVGRFFGKSGAQLFRLGYNLLAGITFLPIGWMMLTSPDLLVYRAPLALAVVFRFGQLVAIVAMAITLLQTDILAFAGLRQLFGGERPSRMISEGLYRFVRHPLYTLGLVVLWLQPTMTANMLAVFGALTVYIVLGASFEERRLVREFGDAYTAYRASTPMLLPRVSPRRGA